MQGGLHHMELKEALVSRRAVNFFDPEKPVTDDQLRGIIETAVRAPSGYNLQPWSLIVVKSPEARERLKAVARNQAKITDAPVVLIVLADRNGWKPGNVTMEKVFKNMVDLGYMKPEGRAGFESGTKSLYDGAEKSLAFAVKNAGFFAMALMLAAKDAGLDTHPMDGFDHEGVRKAFDIPDNCWVPMLIAVGHFDQKKTLMPPKWRKGYGDIVVKEL
jgi:nitroreductase